MVEITAATAAADSSSRRRRRARSKLLILVERGVNFACEQWLLDTLELGVEEGVLWCVCD